MGDKRRPLHGEGPKGTRSVAAATDLCSGGQLGGEGGKGIRRRCDAVESGWIADGSVRLERESTEGDALWRLLGSLLGLQPFPSEPSSTTTAATPGL
jgi:hypothetical protein